MITVTAFWLQAILREPTPILIEARCFVNLWGQGCPLGNPVASKIENTSAEEIETSSESIPEKGNRVYVQFSGALSREDVIAVSKQLAENGWNVQGVDLGGERTAKAAGIDQVRYFHSEDENNAKHLAVTYNKLANWDRFDPLAVAFVSGYELAVPLGHLEVWTSVD